MSIRRLFEARFMVEVLRKTCLPFCLHFNRRSTYILCKEIYFTMKCHPATGVLGNVFEAIADLGRNFAVN